ncbi:hypothetical protein E4634_01680 [Mangrovimicrobium sediminis]|uniref:DUF1585 domain-containing protein n=1 Tax=Mangrovimicrobium sediminis TaxID=2562682 RepID=A0A4Z0M8K5_9GAMM|nr:hypothetical protein [Haliea sp. SAOS-164]TGD75625.1 hypothetical protein E4634_01680 [Haliea sp. SAOS-164]
MTNKFRQLAGYCAIVAVLLVPSLAAADAREQARRIHDRLTGVPPTDAMLDAMTTAVAGGRAEEAALYAIDGAPGVAANGDFYTVVLKNWVTPWTNEAQDRFAPLNDYSATVIGMVRDDVDFREILSADTIYVGQGAGLPAYSRSDNDHYAALERSGANLGDPGVLVPRSQSAVTGLPGPAVAGVLSTRAAARAFFVDGTNRAMFRFTMLNHLCMDLEQLKDGTRPADRIRQDVSRSPGGDSRLFLNNCVECHAGMDPMAQAYAYYDFDYPSEEAMPNLEEEARMDLGQIVYTPGAVQGKYLINENSFPAGYVTPNDHWTNYWRLGVNSARIGWLGAAGNSGSEDLAANPAYSEGNGMASLGRELANSRAFGQCQVKKAFQSICAREPAASEAGAVNQIVNGFNSGHNMKQVFAQVAAYCAAHL